MWMIHGSQQETCRKTKVIWFAKGALGPWSRWYQPSWTTTPLNDSMSLPSLPSLYNRCYKDICYPSESPLLSQSLLRSTPTPRPHSDHMENVMPFATVNSSITMKTWQARFSFQTNKNRSNLHSRHGNEVQQQPVSFPWTAMHLAIEELVRNRFNFLNHNCCCYSSTAK